MLSESPDRCVSEVGRIVCFDSGMLHCVHADPSSLTLTFYTPSKEACEAITRAHVQTLLAVWWPFCLPAWVGWASPGKSHDAELALVIPSLAKSILGACAQVSRKCKETVVLVVEAAAATGANSQACQGGSEAEAGAKAEAEAGVESEAGARAEAEAISTPSPWRRRLLWKQPEAGVEAEAEAQAEAEAISPPRPRARRLFGKQTGPTPVGKDAEVAILCSICARNWTSKRRPDGSALWWSHPKERTPICHRCWQKALAEDRQLQGLPKWL